MRTVGTEITFSPILDASWCRPLFLGRVMKLCDNYVRVASFEAVQTCITGKISCKSLKPSFFSRNLTESSRTVQTFDFLF